MYIQKISELFAPYRKEIIDNAESVSCDKRNDVDFSLLTHQKIVRDYLNIYTPYRGLLLYHGLGSGKTCTSIAIAEGMKSHKPIVLMTPASLKMNFFSEIKKCGDVMYRRQQYWEFISTEGHADYVNVLAQVLQLPVGFIKRKNGAWLVDSTQKNANFNDLDTQQQKQIDEQLDMMIRAKYLDINYNGLNTKNTAALTDNFTRNPFDNSTVIIDEAHNFVSTIVNKLNQKNSIPYILYDYLMSANNAKIILLTGTPIINYPNELGVLFNILRGYIKQWTLQLELKTTAPAGFKLNREQILDIFEKEGLRTQDYVEYSGNKLTITRNPYGFINIDKNRAAKEAKMKAKRGGGQSGNVGEADGLTGNIMNDVVTHKPKKSRKTKKQHGPVIKYVSHNKTKKNPVLNGETAEHAPAYKLQDGIIYINTTDYENDAGDAEIEYEATTDYRNRVVVDLHKGGNSKIIAGGDPFTDYKGVMLDDTGNISDDDFIQAVKTSLQRNHLKINTAGSKLQLLKALPDDNDTFLKMFVNQDKGDIANEITLKKRVLGLASYFRSAQEKLMPSFVKTESGTNYHIVPIDMSDYQFKEYAVIRKEEADRDKQNQRKAKKNAGKTDNLYKISSSYRIFSRAACNFVFPDPPGRPMPFTGKPETIGKVVDENIIDASVDENEMGDNGENETEEPESKNEMREYQKRIVAALKEIQYNPDKQFDDQYLTPKNLAMYSPKFMRILENIQSTENEGLHLLYSQFRTIEGIGVLRLILLANGFAEFKIKKSESSGEWEVVQHENDAGKPRFVLYTGTESSEEKEIIRNIYNSSWGVVPDTITTKLREISSNNFYGEVIKLMMITSSGAEGINLKNTRFVHIVEPYWNMVRIEQVVGRARRICSHQDLPEKYRNVKVFLYVTVFSEEQIKNKKNREMMNRDTSRIDGHPVTTDESLLDTSILKDKIATKLLDVIKETAIDCSVYNPDNKDENLVCYGYGRVDTNAFATYPTLEQDMSQIEETAAKKKKLMLKKTKPIDGVVYVYDPNTLEVYSLESYEQTKEGKGELVLVGRIVKVGNRVRIDKVT